MGIKFFDGSKTVDVETLTFCIKGKTSKRVISRFTNGDVTLHENPFGFELHTDGTYNAHVHLFSPVPERVILPSSFEGIPVTRLTARVTNGKDFTSIVIPDSIKVIGDWTFDSCKSLTDVFYKGTKEQWDAIRISGVGTSCLRNANIHYYSESVPVDVDNYYWYYKDGEIAKWTDADLLKFTFVGIETAIAFVAAADSVTLPEVVTVPSTYKGCAVASVYPDGFASQPSRVIHLPDSITGISVRAFKNCTNLEFFYVPNSVTGITGDVFSGCANLKGIYIPAGVTQIDASAFTGCTSLAEIYYGGTPEQWAAITVNNSNAYFSNAKVYTYSATEVTQDNYWKSIEYSAEQGKYIIERWHNYSIIDSKAATCTEDGYITYRCANCGHTYTETIPATGHDWDVDVEVVEPTCTTGGYTIYTCNHCGATHTDDETEALGHTYGEWTIDLEPTCTTEGSRRRKCSVCGGAEQTETIEALGHDWFYIGTLAPNCVNDGEIEYSCEICGAYKTETDPTAPATGHTWGAWITDTNPTCSTAGTKHRICSKCGDIETEEIPIDPTNHVWSEWEDVHPAECEAAGMRERKCTVCGHIETETIPAPGHDWDVEVKVVEPTCTTGGYTLHTCNNCGATYKDNETEALGHSYSISDEVDSTCTEKGYIEYTCDECLADSYRVEKELDPDKHTESDWYYGTVPTVTKEGSRVKYCTDCDTLLAFEYLNTTHALPPSYYVFSFNQDNGEYQVAVDPESVEHLPSRVGLPIRDGKTAGTGIMVLQVAERGFAHCENIKELYIPANYTYIHDDAFGYCTNLRKVVFDSESEIYYIGRGAFAHCTSLTECVLPSKTKYVHEDAFYNTPLLKKVEVPITVESMGSRVFASAPNLTVYCEAESKPEAWADDWVDDTVTVVWGHTIEDCSAGHDWDVEVEVVEPTCSEQGYTIHTCNRCGEVLHDNYTEPTNLHNWGDWTIDIEPTCIGVGSKTCTCKDCGQLESQSIPMVAHTPGDWIIDKEPTTEEEGLKHQECTECGYIFPTLSIPKLEADTTYLTDENGNVLTDENGNLLTI